MERHACDPKEIALKSFFLGPQAENAPWVIQLVNQVLVRWSDWRKSLFPRDGIAVSFEDQESQEFKKRRRDFETVVQELMVRLEKEVPKFSPRYVGHMFSEISLPALLGHIVTLLHNPNNISGEASRIGIQIEDEAVGFLLSMVGYEKGVGTGHFTSGGTVANFEAVIRAHSRLNHWLIQGAITAEQKQTGFSVFQSAHQGWERNRNTQAEGINEITNSYELAKKYERLSGKSFLGPVIVIPQNKHYSWQKACHLVGLGDEALWAIPLDTKGKMSIPQLRKMLLKAEQEGRPILMVVSVVGTTELGGIDPVAEVHSLLEEWRIQKGIHVWHHVDAAYGGLFCSIDLEKSKTLSEENKTALRAIKYSDSLTLDPHKLGYVPYASGAFLTREKRNYYFKSFSNAPYIDFNPSLDKGPYTLEGSRSAGGAIATWMTAKTMGLDPEGYGLLIERTLRIRNELAHLLKEAEIDVKIAPGCDTNVLCFLLAKQGETLSESNDRTRKIFDVFSPKENGEFIVSKTVLQWSTHEEYLSEWTKEWGAKRDSEGVTLIRMCLMNPFFGSQETKVKYPEAFVRKLKEILGSP